MADYKKKIKDLLDLAESSNEHEARAALLKARELMAKYKISDAELKDPTKQEVIRVITDIDYSIRRDPWVSDLARIIAEYHCCKSFQRRGKRKQTAEIGFIGLSDDITVCDDVFTYAVECIRSKTNNMRKTYRVETADGYGYGFVTGLYEAYNKQQEEENWGLVLIVPEEVNEAYNNMRLRKTKTDVVKKLDAHAYKKGVSDGHKFHEQKRLKEGV